MKLLFVLVCLAFLASANCLQSQQFTEIQKHLTSLEEKVNSQEIRIHQLEAIIDSNAHYKAQQKKKSFQNFFVSKHLFSLEDYQPVASEILTFKGGKSVQREFYLIGGKDGMVSLVSKEGDLLHSFVAFEKSKIASIHPFEQTRPVICVKSIEGVVKCWNLDVWRNAQSLTKQKIKPDMRKSDKNDPDIFTFETTELLETNTGMLELTLTRLRNGWKLVTVNENGVVFHNSTGAIKGSLELDFSIKTMTSRFDQLLMATDWGIRFIGINNGKLLPDRICNTPPDDEIVSMAFDMKAPRYLHALTANGLLLSYNTKHSTAGKTTNKSLHCKLVHGVNLMEMLPDVPLKDTEVWMGVLRGYIIVYIKEHFIVLKSHKLQEFEPSLASQVQVGDVDVSMMSASSGTSATLMTVNATHMMSYEAVLPSTEEDNDSTAFSMDWLHKLPVMIIVIGGVAIYQFTKMRREKKVKDAAFNGGPGGMMGGHPPDLTDLPESLKRQLAQFDPNFGKTELRGIGGGFGDLGGAMPSARGRRIAEEQEYVEEELE
eukprot:TRINITY_DN18092_c0_g1_i1.p1 TRINITY_DN18092_c0_g1~~TRINITY_DN18092_c0_g1_i1.p1  ORF type:complete len:543 (-),score=139.96 TRINITY_DN18092_c0_g1_i1:265-1893(-)